MEAVAARKGLDQQFAARRQHRLLLLDAQPVGHLLGKRLPAAGVGEHAAHLVGEIGRQRKLAAGIDRHLGIDARRVGDEALALADALEAQHLAGEEKGVAGRQRLQEILLDLAQQRPAARRRAAAGAHVAHVEHRGFHDGADVEAILLRHLGIRHPPAAVPGEADAGVALVAAQRVAAGGDEIDDAVEVGAAKGGIGRGAGDFAIEFVGKEGRAAGAAQHMLGEHVERAGHQRRRILRAEIVGLDGGAALHHLEAVGRHEDRLRRFVHAVVGAADALGESACSLRRADMHH